jgi:hypothetical protein
MKYNKDYSARTADEWFSMKKWTAFLMTIPLGRTIDKECESVREVLAIRAVAGNLSGQNSSCERRFSVTTDVINEKKVFVTASKK